MASIKVSLLGDERSLVRSFKRSTKAAEQFNRSMITTGKGTSRVRGALRSFGPALGVGGVAAGFVGAVKAAGSFDRAMRNVNTNAKLGEPALAHLRAQVLALAGRTAQAPETLAKGLYDITSSGFSAKDAIKILAVTSKAATAGLTDTATSSKAIVAGLNAYHLSADSAGKVSDILFTTVQKGVLSFEELAQNMGDLVPAAAPLGVRLEEVGAAIATVTLQGVPAAEAATRVKNTMLQLAKPSANLKKLFKEQGFASGEAAVKSLGFSGVLELIQKKTKGNVTATAALTPEIRALLGVVGITGKNLVTYQSNLRAMENAQKGAGATAGAFAEQSKSAGVKFQKLGAQLKVLQVEVGNALLPAVLKVTGAMSAWLSKTQNTRKTLGLFRQVLSGIGTILAALRTAFRGLNFITGSTRRTVTLLIGAYVAFKALGMASAIGRIGQGFRVATAATAANTGAVAANTAANRLSLGTGTAAGASGFNKLGAASTAAAAKSAKSFRLVRGGMVGLRAAAGRLTSAPYLIVFTLVAIGAKRVADQIEAIAKRRDKAETATFKKGEGVETTLVPRLAKRIRAMKAAGKSSKAILKTLRADLGGSLKADDLIGEAFAFSANSNPKETARIKAAVGKKAKSGIKAAKDATKKVAAAEAKKKDAGPQGISVDQRNQFFDAIISRRLDRVQDIAGAGGQLAALKKIANQIKARIVVTKDITRKLKLEDQLLDVTRQEKGLRAQAAQDKQAAKEAAAAKKQAAAQAKLAKTTARQFFTLGLDATGGERVPFKKTLQRQLGTVSAAVKGTFLDTPKTRSLLARIRKVLKEGIVPTDVRAKVKEMLAGVNDELKNGAQGHTKFKKANTDAMLEGLGLSGKQIQALRSRLSQVGADGTVNRRRGLAPGGVAAADAHTPVVVHTTVNLDGHKVAVNTTKHQAARRATSRRG